MTMQLNVSPSSAAPGESVTITAHFKARRGPHLVRWSFPQDRLSVEASAEATLTMMARSTPAPRRGQPTRLKFEVEPGPAGPVTVRVHALSARPTKAAASPTKAAASPSKAAAGTDLMSAFQELADKGGGDDDQTVIVHVIDSGADTGRQPVEVTMRRAFVDRTDSQALWTLIRQTSNALSFQSYQAFMEIVLCGPGSSRPAAAACRT